MSFLQRIASKLKTNESLGVWPHLPPNWIKNCKVDFEIWKVRGQQTRCTQNITLLVNKHFYANTISCRRVLNLNSSSVCQVLNHMVSTWREDTVQIQFRSSSLQTDQMVTPLVRMNRTSWNSVQWWRTTCCSLERRASCNSWEHGQLRVWTVKWVPWPSSEEKLAPRQLP